MQAAMSVVSPRSKAAVASDVGPCSAFTSLKADFMAAPKSVEAGALAPDTGEAGAEAAEAASRRALFCCNMAARIAITLLLFMTFMPQFPYRSEEHTSELQSLMRISYAVFCLKKKKIVLVL